jgi:hypothetical protein
MKAKPLPLGCVNAREAAGLATIYNRAGKKIGVCLDTPNCVAATFRYIPSATYIQSVWQGKVTRNSKGGMLRCLAPNTLIAMRENIRVIKPSDLHEIKQD